MASHFRDNDNFKKFHSHSRHMIWLISLFPKISHFWKIFQCFFYILSSEFWKNIAIFLRNGEFRGNTENGNESVQLWGILLISDFRRLTFLVRKFSPILFWLGRSLVDKPVSRSNFSLAEVISNGMFCVRFCDIFLDGRKILEGRDVFITPFSSVSCRVSHLYALIEIKLK